MKASTVLPLLVGLAAAAVAIGAWSKTSGRSKAPAEPGPAGTVVVAKVDIPYAARITEDHLTTVSFKGARFPIAKTFAETRDLVGRVASAKVVAGGPITEPMLAPDGTPSGASYQIQDGYRACAVPVESYAVRHLDPGSRVDVVPAGSRRLGAAGRRPVGFVLQDVEVFAVGGRRLGMEPVEETVKSVDLLVPVGQLDRLNAALSSGGVRLVMRGATDRRIIELPESVAEPEGAVFLAQTEENMPEPTPSVEEKTLRVKVYNGRDQVSTETYSLPTGDDPS